MAIASVLRTLLLFVCLLFAHASPGADAATAAPALDFPAPGQLHVYPAFLTPSRIGPRWRGFLLHASP